MELSKNIPYFRISADLKLDHLDGQATVFLQTRDLSIAPLVAMSTSEETLQILITKLASMLVSRSLEQMLKSCQVSGSIKSAHALELRLEITCGCRDTSFKELLRNSDSQSVSIQSSLQTGMDQDAMPISQQRP